MPATTLQIGPLSLRRLRERSPLVDVAYLEEIRALYMGGKFLLRNPAVLERVFPKRPGETEPSYEERKRRAFYVGNMSTVIDFIVSGLSQDPARIRPDGGDIDAKVTDEFLLAFDADTSPPGGEKLAFHGLLAEQARNGLLYERWWSLVDLPDMGSDYAPSSLLEQERDGALECWALPLDPLAVLDWQASASGGLEWVMTCCVERTRSSPAAPRDTTRYEYRLYTPTQWGLYVVEAKDGTAPPSDDAVITPKVGDHGFGRVPVVMGKLAVGMWAGNKLHSLAVEYLNKSCGLSYAESKALFQELYEFLNNSMSGIGDAPKDANAADPHRAVRAARGPGKVQVRTAEDKAMYIGPDPGGFTHALASLKELRDDMFRVTYQMALASDTSGAVIRRSAESKGKDGESGVVVLTALGGPLREHGDGILALVVKIRTIAGEYVTAGYESFEVADLGAQIDQAVMLEGVEIKSATAKKLISLRLLRAVLGADATPEVMKDIENQLDEAITQDALTAPPPPMMLPPGATPPDPSADPDAPPPEEPKVETKPPPKKRAAKPGGKR